MRMGMAFIVAGLALTDARAAGSLPTQVPVGDAAVVTPQGGRPDAAEGVAVLRFGDLFVRPVGPRGLEPTPRLLALDGRLVSMVGYVAGSRLPTPGRFVLTPMPVEIGDEDEQFADDLPPSVVFVHLGGTMAVAPAPNAPALVQLVGRLAVGPQEEPDGRVSSVRLLLDESSSRALVSMPRAAAPMAPHSTAP